MIFANEIPEKIPATVAMFEKKNHGLSAAFFLGSKKLWNLQKFPFFAGPAEARRCWSWMGEILKNTPSPILRDVSQWRFIIEE